MPLTDTTIRTAKPGEKPRRLFDGGGLYLEVAPACGKGWRLKYRFAGREKRISLCVYPAVGLSEARVRRDGARKQLAAGRLRCPICPGLWDALPLSGTAKLAVLKGRAWCGRGRSGHMR